jgi:hypothetical protein
MLSTSEIQTRILSVKTTDQTEVLRQIIAQKVDHDIDYEEAQEIGNNLLEFYQLLAEEVDDGIEQ